MITMDNPYRIGLWSFALGVFLIFLVAGCGGGGGSDGGEEPAAPVMPPQPAGNLVLRLADTEDLMKLEVEQDYFGEVYTGTYTASDGVSIDVWVSIREPNAQIGTVPRLGVTIQGGTGGSVTELLGDDRGAHTLWVVINYRGSNLTDINNPEWECAPGAEFISCLKKHAIFSKINPKLRAGC